MLHSGMLGYDGGRSPSPRAPAAERRDRPLGARLRRLARSLLPAATSLPRGFASPAPRGPARRFRAARSARPRPRGRRRLAASEARYSSPASWRAFRARSPASSAGRARSDLRARPAAPGHAFPSCARRVAGRSHLPGLPRASERTRHRGRAALPSPGQAWPPEGRLLLRAEWPRRPPAQVDAAPARTPGWPAGTATAEARADRYRCAGVSEGMRTRRSDPQPDFCTLVSSLKTFRATFKGAISEEICTCNTMGRCSCDTTNHKSSVKGKAVR